MKRKKKIRVFSILLLSVFLSFTATNAAAHSGRTDASGGHTDSSTGEYHYHHGYPAHDHYDIDGDGIKDCPYNFSDRTNRQTGETKPKATYPTETRAASPTEAPSESAKNQQISIEYRIPKFVWFLIGGMALTILSLILYLRSQSEDLDSYTSILEQERMDRKKKEEQNTTELARIRDENKILSGTCAELDKELEEIKKEKEKLQTDLRKDLQELDALFDACHGWQMLYEVCGAYPRDDIGPDNLPRSNDNSGTRWGEKYTFFISNQRAETRYHRQSCRYAGISTINAYEIEQDTRHAYIPCKVCSPQLPDLVWYHTYLKLYNFKRKYM